MFRKRIATLDLLTELPGRPFSDAEREVRRALNRYIATDLERRRLGPGSSCGPVDGLTFKRNSGRTCSKSGPSSRSRRHTKQSFKA
jgi:hypothetical protein